MDRRCSLVSQSQKCYSGITSSSLVPPPNAGCAKSIPGALPGVPAAEMQFVLLSPKAGGSEAPSFLGSVSIHCIYLFGEIEPKTVLINVWYIKNNNKRNKKNPKKKQKRKAISTQGEHVPLQ